MASFPRPNSLICRSKRSETPLQALLGIRNTSYTTYTMSHHIFALFFVVALVAVSSAELSGVSGLQKHFDEDGYLVLRKFFFKGKLREWRRFSTNYFQEVFHLLHVYGYTSFPYESQKRPDGSLEYAMEEGKANGFQEIVMRSPGRYELSMIRSELSGYKIPTIQPLLDELSEVIPPMLHVKSMEDVNVDYSMIVSTAKATAQGWHSDGDHFRLDQHMPCHVLNVFIPLVDITEAKGPTELFPSSHFRTRADGAVRVRSDELKPSVAPLLDTGDILLFDYRLIHRGKPNFSNSSRPVLVLTLSQKWFHDEKNWPLRSLFDKSNHTEGVVSPCVEVLRVD